MCKPYLHLLCNRSFKFFLHKDYKIFLTIISFQSSSKYFINILQIKMYCLFQLMLFDHGVIAPLLYAHAERIGEHAQP